MTSGLLFLFTLKNICTDAAVSSRGYTRVKPLSAGAKTVAGTIRIADCRFSISLPSLDMEQRRRQFYLEPLLFGLFTSRARRDYTKTTSRRSLSYPLLSWLTHSVVQIGLTVKNQKWRLFTGSFGAGKTRGQKCRHSRGLNVRRVVVWSYLTSFVEVNRSKGTPASIRRAAKRWFRCPYTVFNTTMCILRIGSR